MANAETQMAVLLSDRPSPSGLALLRFMAGLSQRALAERAGISRPTVAKIELGEHVPRIATAVAITEALGLDDPRLVFPEAFAPNNQRPEVASLGAGEASAVGVGRLRGS